MRYRRRRTEAGHERVKTWNFLRELRRALPYLRPYKLLVSASLAVMALSVLAGLIAPWPLAILVDTIVGNKPLPALLSPLTALGRTALIAFSVGAGLFVTAFANGLGVAMEYVTTRLELNVVQDLRSDLLAHIHRQSLSFHDNRSAGSLMYVFTTEAGALGRLVGAMLPLIQSVATVVGMFVISFLIDPELALLAMTIVPLAYLSTGYYTSRVEPRLMYVRGLEGEILSVAHESMTMIRVILSFGRESYHHAIFRERSQRALDARVQLTVRQTLFSLAVSMITAAGTALVLGVGAYQVIDRQLTVGELLVLMAYIAAVYQPLSQISTTLAQLQEQVVNLRLATDMLDTVPEVQDTPGAREIGRARGHVEYRGVSFSYAKREHTLEQISFEAKPGQRVAVVGPTGAGKTTLLNLLPRFYDVQQGQILLDGLDVREVTLASLRSQISIVLQEPVLFSATILDNIRYGRLQASVEEVVEVARAANVHEFVSALPDGYETQLGDRGAMLSGGERQRLSIARAFLENAPVLILDEPTSSVDASTEAGILDTLDRLMEGRTTFIIAHRLSTIHAADLIIVVDHGRVVGKGTHEELLAGNELYRRLFLSQSTGAMPPSAPRTRRSEGRQIADGFPRARYKPEDVVRDLVPLKKDRGGGGFEATTPQPQEARVRAAEDEAERG